MHVTSFFRHTRIVLKKMDYFCSRFDRQEYKQEKYHLTRWCIHCLTQRWRRPLNTWSEHQEHRRASYVALDTSICSLPASTVAVLVLPHPCSTTQPVSIQDCSKAHSTIGWKKNEYDDFWPRIVEDFISALCPHMTRLTIKRCCLFVTNDCAQAWHPPTNGMAVCRFAGKQKHPSNLKRFNRVYGNFN